MRFGVSGFLQRAFRARVRSGSIVLTVFSSYFKRRAMSVARMPDVAAISLGRAEKSTFQSHETSRPSAMRSLMAIM